MHLTDATRRWLGLIAIALGVALIVVDTTIVNVIVPSIVRDLGVTSAQAQWIQESYAIVFAALLLLVGRVADILGARRVFLTGVVIFGATSLLAGLAPTGELLVLARFLQGAGAALILPTSLALLNASFTGKARGPAFAVWGSTIGAATALGPLLGGWLSEHASWRWAFGINIPLIVVICLGALAFLPRSPRGTGRVDVVGAVLSIIGLGLLAFGLIEGRTYGWIRSIEPFDVSGVSWASGPHRFSSHWYWRRSLWPRSSSVRSR
jgi:EmrB/QacA subfamily drug resistance transporter